MDFHKNRRIPVAGSATPLATKGQESGVGRWHTVRLATLSFCEHLQIKQIPAPGLPNPSSLAQLVPFVLSSHSHFTLHPNIFPFPPPASRRTIA